MDGRRPLATHQAPSASSRTMRYLSVLVGGVRQRAARVAAGLLLVSTMAAVPAAEATAGWQLATTPPVRPSVALVAATAVPGTNVVWLAGVGIPTAAPIVFERRSSDGSWTVFRAPATSDTIVLQAMSATAPDDVWAVGTTAPTGPEPPQPVAEHWDGGRWSLVPVPAPVGGGQLMGISARTAKDAWAVGSSGSGVPLLEHWDGRGWRMQAAPVPNAQLNGVAVVPHSPVVWAVGVRAGRRAGSQVTLVVRRSRGHWRVVPSPSYTAGPAGPRSELRAVVAIDAREAWAVGRGETPTGVRTLVEHWSGGRWTALPGRQPVNTEPRALARIPGTSAVWAVGSRYPYAESSLTFSERITPNGWQVVPTPSPDRGCEYANDLSAVTITADGTAWAAGAHGHLANGCGDLAVGGPLLMRHPA